MHERVRIVLGNENGKILFAQQDMGTPDFQWCLPGYIDESGLTDPEEDSTIIKSLLGVSFIGILQVNLPEQIEQSQSTRVVLGLTEEQLRPDPEQVRGIMWVDSRLLRNSRIPYDREDKYIAGEIFRRFPSKLQSIRRLLYAADTHSSPNKFSIIR